MSADRQRVVVTSIGTAPFAVVNVLEAHCAVPSAQLAACLYRAPGILFDDLAPAAATKLVEQLAPSGLELAVEQAGAPFLPGSGDLDLTLEVSDFSKAHLIVAEIVALLGVEATVARDVLCQSPAQLLGNVSEATAVAVARRFQPLGASVIALSPRAAAYDLFVTARSPQLVNRILENLRALGRDVAPAARVRRRRCKA